MNELTVINQAASVRNMVVETVKGLIKLVIISIAIAFVYNAWNLNSGLITENIELNSRIVELNKERDTIRDTAQKMLEESDSKHAVEVAKYQVTMIALAQENAAALQRLDAAVLAYQKESAKGCIDKLSEAKPLTTMWQNVTSVFK